MSFHQALDLVFELDETTVGCTQDILGQRYFLNQFSEVPWVVPTFVVIEGEVESEEGVKKIEYAVDGVECVHIGLTDLSMNMHRILTQQKVSLKYTSFDDLLHYMHSIKSKAL
nr:hypothetical protein [Tanacetum cinerariifolium]